MIVLAVEEAHISRRLQNLLKDENNQLKVDDAAKIIGCWKALSKQGLTDELVGDDSADAARRGLLPGHRDRRRPARPTKSAPSKLPACSRPWSRPIRKQEEIRADALACICEAEHVDGSMNASEKEAKLDWLKAEPPDNTCRILSNVRCLSEGVDVPALDAVLFLTPRNSQVDVVQSVGRVMRNAPGKKRGYVDPAGGDPGRRGAARGAERQQDLRGGVAGAAGPALAR